VAHVPLRGCVIGDSEDKLARMKGLREAAGARHSTPRVSEPKKNIFGEPALVSLLEALQDSLNFLAGDRVIQMNK
jgi:hypothetical protein